MEKEKKSNLNNKKQRNSHKGIGFWRLYDKFRFKVIRHFIISVITTLFQISIGEVVGNIFSIKTRKSEIVYSELFPKLFKLIGIDKFFNSSLEFFIFWVLFSFLVYYINYWDKIWENELRARGGNYTKNLILEKFRSLSFEQKKNRSSEVNSLIDFDAREIRSNWEHLPNHAFHNVISILFNLFFYWEQILSINIYQSLSFFFILTLTNAASFFFTRKVMREETEYKEKLSEESALINKEKDNIILIESSGLGSLYKEKQREITKRNENFYLEEISKTRALSRYLPFALEEILPYFLLFINNENSFFPGRILSPFWSILNSFKSIAHCYQSYGDYGSSQRRINKFLSLNENEKKKGGIKIDEDSNITKIEFVDVFFRYEGQDDKDWVLKNYNNSFDLNQINHLVGKNGVGKSTILYLLLGMLSPQKGNIIIHVNENKINLKDLDLVKWRENNISYCSHQNLINDGSTGQKQLKNINDLFERKEKSQIWLFDEADNALDKDNQNLFNEKIDQLVKAGKLVIRVKH